MSVESINITIITVNPQLKIWVLFASIAEFTLPLFWMGIILFAQQRWELPVLSH